MKRLNIVLILSVTMLISAIVICMTFGNSTVGTIAVNTATQDEATDNEEMRGLWVSYISLDMQGTDRSFDSFKSKFDKIVQDASDFGCNTLIVQVRPFCDALYNSQLFPASHVLSGTQGVSADYDALEYMCVATHSKNMKLHAWINPYRVSTAGTPASLAESNPFVQDNSIGAEITSGIYLNPAKKAVRNLIVQGVEEIIRNYDVDGIQFDDYFYPPDCGSFDEEEFNTYRKSVNNITKAMYIDQWRQNNVNLMLSEVYRTIKSIDPSVVFGISPQGNIDNNYAIGADVKTWCENIGYADYICPQMYYSVDNPTLKFEVSLQDWKDFSLHKDLKVYIGLGAYKAGTDADSGTWLNKNDVLATELVLLRRYGYDGYMIYDYSALVSESAEKELSVFRSII
ncbi:MAG: family 10 glycosylhydrolase [Ruminococcus sp.]|nr:family 10 glycosylhydrolase [Ruminococcus sp.]